MFGIRINTNITAKTTTFTQPPSYANCLDSLLRNKAKNALSLSTPISPGMAGAKIRKISFRQAEKEKSGLFY